MLEGVNNLFFYCYYYFASSFVPYFGSTLGQWPNHCKDPEIVTYR